VKLRLKLTAICLAFAAALAGCWDSKPRKFVIAESKSYETSLFRQHCAVCHGPEGEGKTLDDGRQVPSLRTGEFKFNTRGEIRHQIAEGGNGMTPFKGQLTARELDLISGFVYKELRGGQ
jgi:mono/diheme cytochrome c family protein